MVDAAKPAGCASRPSQSRSNQLLLRPIPHPLSPSPPSRLPRGQQCDDHNCAGGSFTPLAAHFAIRSFFTVNSLSCFAISLPSTVCEMVNKARQASADSDVGYSTAHFLHSPFQHPRESLSSIVNIHSKESRSVPIIIHPQWPYSPRSSPETARARPPLPPPLPLLPQ